MAAFIKFDGVDGESKDESHQGWSDLTSFVQGIEAPSASTATGRRRREAVAEDIHCSKDLDKSSPKLAEAVFKHKLFPKVEIHVTRASASAGTEELYYAYELKKVLVTSYTVSESSQGSQVPREEFSLGFEEIKVTYTEYGDDGSSLGNVEYSWNLKTAAGAKKKVVSRRR
jgi:type VI secretion system secreted protein Hcp